MKYSIEGMTHERYGTGWSTVFASDDLEEIEDEALRIHRAGEWQIRIVRSN